MVAAIIIGIFIISFLYAHSRGKEKQKLTANCSITPPLWGRSTCL